MGYLELPGFLLGGLMGIAMPVAHKHDYLGTLRRYESHLHHEQLPVPGGCGGCSCPRLALPALHELLAKRTADGLKRPFQTYSYSSVLCGDPLGLRKIDFRRMAVLAQQVQQFAAA